ncbi:SDR family oxidoreductase [Acinetobacter bohemicus]|uniref:SDR family oxidoreductase n=1 Tax=Acinetobacter TaxID=469 RepID=UPI00157E06F4|nr:MULTISPECIES: SDR family oxidoreductase [Acinetobacter]MCO8043413.1 SDR family oxidoreductase [Acinetobacter sp. S4400-12]MCU7225081.1 SDR family oxidoreductase [Acinetobacter bohemicus]QKQ70081.1 glucose 1-dehydrogenase [Acinetobacter sp. 10FS3-1]
MNHYPETPASTETQEHQPGIQSRMNPLPEVIKSNYKGSDKLKDKVALITGGDSGIGRSVSVLFAREGADIVICYLDEDQDAQETKKMVENEGRRCLLIQCDLQQPETIRKMVEQALQEFKTINILVNNAGVQYPQESITDISSEQLLKTFNVNILSMFHLTQAVLPHMHEGDSIINTTSITSYHGHDLLIDYASTKGAITSFTRSLSTNLLKNKTGIRVNGVAPGPIWTPLIPSSFDAEQLEEFGKQTPMGRMGQPSEVAPAYLFLASEEASYISGQVIHVNGGSIING